MSIGLLGHCFAYGVEEKVPRRSYATADDDTLRSSEVDDRRQPDSYVFGRLGQEPKS